jgi:hypothetical protein
MARGSQATGAPPKRRWRRFVRRIERALLGVAMSVVAFVSERIVLKALREGSVEPRPKPASGAPGLSVSPDQIEAD